MPSAGYHIEGEIMSLSLITAIEFDHFVRVVLAGFLHSEVTIFPFGINTILREIL